MTGNKAVILLPLVVFFAVIIKTLIGLSPFVLQELYLLFQQNAKASGVAQLFEKKLSPYVPQTDPNTLFEKINAYRSSQGKSAFNRDTTTCSLSADTASPSANAIFGVCKTCSHAALLSITKYAYPNQILSRMLEEENTKKILEDPKLTHLCVDQNDTNLVLVLSRQSNTPKPSSPPKLITPAVSQNPINFTEAQLWQALVDYRHAHKKPDLQKNDRLCEYARKRVADHLRDFEAKKPEEYPVPEKYPLDAHAGFSADAASGYSFEITGMKALAENLAYWPSATAPSHVIEWGWDTSTEGHREAQLSTDYDHACISGQNGFYVAIFGR